MNWRNGFLRVWIFVTVASVLCSGYLLYSNSRCVQEDTSSAEKLAGFQREASNNIDKYVEGKRKGLPEWQLPDPELNKAQYERTSAGIKEAFAERERCESQKSRSVALLVGIPVASFLLIISGFWIVSGFRRPMKR
jgi:hypothetical protein